MVTVMRNVHSEWKYLPGKNSVDGATVTGRTGLVAGKSSSSNGSGRPYPPPPFIGRMTGAPSTGIGLLY